MSRPAQAHAARPVPFVNATRRSALTDAYLQPHAAIWPQKHRRRYCETVGGHEEVMNSIERAMRMGRAGVEGCAVMRRLVGRPVIEPILTRLL